MSWHEYSHVWPLHWPTATSTKRNIKAAFCVVGTGLFPGTGLSPTERVASCNISRLLERRSTGWTGHLCRAGTITKENNARTQLLGWDVSQGAQCTYATDNHFVHGNTKCLLCNSVIAYSENYWWYKNCWKLSPGESSTCGRDALPMMCDPCPAVSIDRTLPAVGRGCCE